MGVSLDGVFEGDVLEVVFFSAAVGRDIRVAVDVSRASADYEVVRGEVLVVKNMPFDALEGKTVYFDLGDDTVQKGDHLGQEIGSTIELVSV